jgi:hypothetical protein
MQRAGGSRGRRRVDPIKQQQGWQDKVLGIYSLAALTLTLTPYVLSCDSAGLSGLLAMLRSLQSTACFAAHA